MLKGDWTCHLNFLFITHSGFLNPFLSKLFFWFIASL